MSRYLGPRLKLVRRLGPLPGLTRKRLSKTERWKRLVEKPIKKSQYRIRLEEKQKIRFHYGLSEKQLLRYIRIARKSKGSTGEILLRLLEMRLDNIIYRLGMAPTIPSARQIVNHRHVLVNRHIVNIPSYNCRIGDQIKVRNRKNSLNLIESNLTSSKKQKIKIPPHLKMKQKSFLVESIVNRKSIGLKINELLIVEFFSRS